MDPPSDDVDGIALLALGERPLAPVCDLRLLTASLWLGRGIRSPERSCGFSCACAVPVLGLSVDNGYCFQQGEARQLYLQQPYYTTGATGVVSWRWTRFAFLMRSRVIDVGSVDVFGAY
ncbi:hypothetical protein M758_UG065800 [Ceratodon purpureus]|nr:hypothetical protein M758_UG065800 [Ceratodon purpureus]